MFTGLVEECGVVDEVVESGEGKRFTVRAEGFFSDVSVGESISVSGACLTVEEFTDDSATFFLAEETLGRTWFSQVEEGDKVNLEKSLTPEDRMGGHYVQGHVDSTSKILEVEELEEGWDFSFSLPEEASQYIVEKGFVTLEGISLTVTKVDENCFSVTVIPETWDTTNLSEKEEGEVVNFEADVMAKYAEKNR